MSFQQFNRRYRRRERIRWWLMFSGMFLLTAAIVVGFYFAALTATKP